MRALPLAVLALLALAAPQAAADTSPWDGIHQSWESVANAARDVPNDTHARALQLEDQGLQWCDWALAAGAGGADNVRDQLHLPF